MALRLSRLFGRGGGDDVVMEDGSNNVTLENVVAPAEPDAMQDVFVTEFTGSDEELSALVAALQQRGLIDTSTGEIVWADEATSNLSQSPTVLDWLNANHFERGPNGIMVWNGQPVSHGILPFIEQQNVTAPERIGEATGDEAQAFAGDRFVAAREAGSGNATGVHDIHMNQGNSQSLQQQMQSENQRVHGAPGAPEADGVVHQHNQTDLEFARAPRAGVTGSDDWESPTPLKVETEVTDYREGGTNAKWEGPEFDASKNEVSIESLEIAHEGVRGGSHDLPGVVGTAYALPEVGDEVLVEFQAKEPGRIEYPNLVHSAKHDTMELEEVHFVRGTARSEHLDDDGPSHLLGDTDGDGHMGGTDAMSLNFEEIDLAPGHHGHHAGPDIDLDGLDDDFDGIDLPD